MKTMFATTLRWLAIVTALVLSVDAVVAIYKTIVFRVGVDSFFELSMILLICFALLVMTSLMGLGAFVGMNARGSPFSARAILCVTVGIGLILLSANAFPLSPWIGMALASKSESAAVCVGLCCILLLLNWREAR